MARISTYGLDSKPELGDKVVGTDTNASASFSTKNYTLQDIVELFNKSNSLAVADQSVFLFQDDLSEGRDVGTISFSAGGGVGTAFSNITSLIFSKNALGGVNIASFLQLFLNIDVLIAEVGNINNYGRYKVTSISDFNLDNTFYEIQLTVSDFNGVLSEDAHYIFSEFGGSSSSSIWTTVSDGISYGGGNVSVTGGDIFLKSGAGNYLNISTTISGTVFSTVGSGIISPNMTFNVAGSDSMKLNGTNGGLKLNKYTSTSTGTSVSAINPIQNFYPSNGAGSDTTTDLGVDQAGNVVRTTQEATWKLTAAQVNAITTSTSATGTTLISAPGAGLLLIVEKVTFMITFTQDNTPNPMSATQQYQIKQLDNGAGPGIVGVIRGDKVNDIIGQGDPDGSGIYEHDTGFASLNRIYMPNTPTFIRRTESGASSSNLPPNVTHMSIKIRYRVYDPATF